MQALWQRDPRWNMAPLGNSKTSTIGMYGCLLTCFSMMADEANVLEMNRRMISGGGFQAEPRGAYAATFDVRTMTAGRVKLMDQFNKASGEIPARVRAWIKAGKPVLLEVDFTPSPEFDQHFVLGVDLNAAGRVIILDPWTGDRRELDAAYHDLSRVRRAFLYDVTGSTPASTAPAATAPTFPIDATALANINVRTAPRLAGGKLTDKPVTTGTAVKALRQVAGESVDGVNQWAEVEVERKVGNFTEKVRGFMAARYLRYASTPITPAPTEPPTTPSDQNDTRWRLGVSCLTDHRAGLDALAADCRFVLFLQGFGTAVNAARAYPNAIILAREWFPHAPDPQWLADHLNTADNNVPRNLRTISINENDWFSNKTIDQLQARFNYQRAFCDAVWKRQPDRVIVLDEHSHGTPDTTDPTAMRFYGDTTGRFAAENAHRIRIGFHRYTYGRRFSHHPGTNQSIIDPEWFEGRPARVRQLAGISAAVKFLSGETGAETGQGGFTQAGYTLDQFREWCEWYVNYDRSLNQNDEGGAIFQVGNHPGWRGYDITPYMPVLREFWAGVRVIKQPSALRTLAVRMFAPEYDTPPAQIEWRKVDYRALLTADQIAQAEAAPRWEGA